MERKVLILRLNRARQKKPRGFASSSGTTSKRTAFCPASSRNQRPEDILRPEPFRQRDL